MFYFSNYPKDSKYYINLDKLVAGKIKYKTCGVSVNGSVELKSKMNTFITEDNHQRKKATKGINENVVDNKLKNEDYENVMLKRS